MENNLLNILYKNRLIINQIKLLDFKVTSELMMFANINSAADLLEQLIGFNDIPEYIACVDLLIEIIGKSNNNAPVKQIKEMLMKFSAALDNFILKALDFNKLNVIFQNTLLSEKYSDIFNKDYVTFDDASLCSMYIYDNTLNDISVSEKYDFSINIEAFLDDLSLKSFLSSNYQYLTYSGNLNYLINGGKCDIVTTGSSYSVYGLDADVLDMDIVDISLIAQDLYYSKVCLEKVLHSNHSIDKVLMSIGHYNFHYDLSRSTNTINTTQMKSIYHPVFGDLHNSKEKYPPYKFTGNFASLSIDEQRIFDLKALSSHIKIRIDNGNYREQYPKFFNKNFSIEDYAIGNTTKKSFGDLHETEQQERIERLVTAHKKLLKYSNTETEYKQIMIDILELLNKRNISPIFVVFPMTKLYRDYMGDVYKDLFYKYMNKLKEKYSFHILDLYDNDDFDNNDFIDTHHLNSVGAKKASKYINDFLIEKYKE